MTLFRYTEYYLLALKFFNLILIYKSYNIFKKTFSTQLMKSYISLSITKFCKRLKLINSYKFIFIDHILIKKKVIPILTNNRHKNINGNVIRIIFLHIF